MKFGSVDNPDNIDFTLPEDHPGTAQILSQSGGSNQPDIYVGCAKWNRQDLKKFYPRGTKDEFTYYASQFNSVEMNTTYHRLYPPAQYIEWRKKVPKNFRFFPKINRYISHLKWLNDIEKYTEDFLAGMTHLEENLGTIFLQLSPRFAPKFFRCVADFLDRWPNNLPLAIELRHPDWFNEPKMVNKIYELLEEHDISNVLVDTAGRRDLLHMRLTNNEAFVRYIGANYPSDYMRLYDWVKRLKVWSDLGIEKIDFFVHQNVEIESPKLAAYFIRKLNKEIGCTLPIPKTSENK